MKVKVINRSNNELPHYETALSAGMDVRAFLTESVTLKPLQRALIPTGLYVEIPDGYEIQVRPRSGLAAKHGVTVLNAPGTIDADYRGEVKVILVNLSDTAFEVANGERVAQLVVARCEQAEWESADTLSDTLRGEGGFGSTGR
ncbi:MAG: dUTP diphosphatase [Tidjanibacter sp.]|nr:dUTP diphosphatase [Tidjanibacter sp.]